MTDQIGYLNEFLLDIGISSENESTSSGKAISEQSVFTLVTGEFAGRRIFWPQSDPGTKSQVLSFSPTFIISSKQDHLAVVIQFK